MSVFDEIMCKVNEISCIYVNSINDDLKGACDALEKFAEECQRGKRETALKNKTVNTLQSIVEDEVAVSDDAPQNEPQEATTEKRLSQKRGKQDVDGMSSPEQEKRQKRNASVKAQNNISKQVNVNLNQKLRREDTAEKSSRRRKGDDKENAEPIIVKVKEEKISLPPEPMETEAVLDIQIKQEPNKDDFAMPPPAAPVPRTRRLQKEQSADSEDERPGRRTRTRKQTDAMPPPQVSAPAPRSSRRAAASAAAAEPEEPAPRPKRTRAKKKASESPTTDAENAPAENGIGSPAEKPRPKRTRRGQKAAEKEETPKPKDPAPEPEVLTPKEERITNEQSPAIPQKTVKKTKDDTTSIISDDSIEPKNNSKAKATKSKVKDKEPVVEGDEIQPIKASKVKGAKSKAPEAVNLEETHIICSMNATVTISTDKTVDLPNGISDHTDGKHPNIMNATVVLEKMARETLVLDKAQPIMDATVVIEKAAACGAAGPDVTDDNSLLTDDSDAPAFSTPPQSGAPEPTSAVKAKVQQFEEMATRTTRTKTRAMAKKDAETDNCTPPDKTIPTKQVLSAETLAKMNSLIFNGKTTQISASATKPSAKLPPVKSVSASASKVSAINKAREEFEANGKDDARKKKEAMLEAKKEQQRRKREEKMAAAAAAREAAARERRAALQAAARERMEKQAHADQGKLERLKEVEKKKLELARKVAETEERRRAEEQARLARLEDEQKRALAARRKQLEESEAVKKEAAIMAKEIEKRQKEYLEKQKMKQRMETDKYHTPMKTIGTPYKAPPMEPVYMCDGFQYLDSDDDDDDDAPVKQKPKMPAPAWGAVKARHHQLALQHLLPPARVDELFSLRVHSPDLRAIFPLLERRVQRTSSAVWRTPPAHAQ